MQSKSKVVLKRTKFWTFFALRNIKGAIPLYLRYHPHLAARQVAKFHEATPFGSKVLTANMLHFKPILDRHCKKIAKGTHVPGGGCARKLGHSLAR